jgi:rubrerythrin
MKTYLHTISLKEALDLAIQVELEAKSRYEEFHRQIGTRASGDAGDFFLKMASNEKKHAEDLKQKRMELFGTGESSLSLEDLYEFQEIEAPFYDQAESFMSIRKALTIARDCEIKAYEFFHKAESIVKDQQIKDLFCELKNEEIEHRKMVEALLEKTGRDDELPFVNKDDVEEPNGL